MSWCRLVRTPNPKLKEEKFYFLFSVNLWFYSDFFFFFGLEPILIRIERCRRAAAAVLPSQWLAPVELLRLHRCRRTQKTYILEITFWIDGGRQCVHCIHSFIKKVNKKNETEEMSQKPNENCLWAHYGIAGHIFLGRWSLSSSPQHRGKKAHN